MPPKKVSSAVKTKKVSKATPKRVAAKGFKLPDPIAAGEILKDVSKNYWRLGKSIGQGGFGEIYLASTATDKPVAENASYVVKIEPHSNGPLFTEMHCYMRIARPENIEAYKKEMKLKRLGMPKFLGSGSHTYKGQKYRFMVMERFGSDLQKIINKHNHKFSYKTVFQVTIQCLDVLEYIHTNQYVHADIKASNLLIGFQPNTQNQVYLVDYGLACRYSIDGKHKEYRFDQRKAHDGTIEFTSRDAHIGAHSRRGDLEILGYNLVQWLCGKLPWEDNLQDCNYVASQKRMHMEDVNNFMNTCFPDGHIPPGIKEFMEYVASLTFDETPNYEKCKVILREGLKKRGHKDDGKLVFLSATPKSKIPTSKIAAKKKSLKRRSDEENIGNTIPLKLQKTSGRSPCMPRNLNSRVSKIDTKEEVTFRKHRQEVEPDFDEELLVEKENQKMLARKQTQRPKRLLLKKDSSLVNPTPQMLQVMAKIREKSISPPICNKKHRHNFNCQQLSNRSSPASDELPPSELTPEMESILRRKFSDRRMSTDSEFSRSASLSPDMFDSEEDEEEAPVDKNNATMYYSPCGGISPGGGECHEHQHTKPRGNRAIRRSSVSGKLSSLTKTKTKTRPLRSKNKVLSIRNRVTRSQSNNETP